MSDWNGVKDISIIIKKKLVVCISFCSLSKCLGLDTSILVLKLIEVLCPAQFFETDIEQTIKIPNSHVYAIYKMR